LIEPSFAKKILFKRANELQESNLADITPDALGWQFLRLENYIDVLNNKEKSRIEQLLERVILYCLMNQTENDFAVSGACQTWMDSIERPGAQIEMQTFRLKIYNLAGRLSASAVKREFWQRLEAKLLLKTRQYFFDNTTAFDSIDPQTGKQNPVARPNIFLAAYIYPQLLLKMNGLNILTSFCRNFGLIGEGYQQLILPVIYSIRCIPANFRQATIMVIAGFISITSQRLLCIALIL